MAKGRKLTISRSERYLGSHGYTHEVEDDGVELGEDDVWSMVDSGGPISNDWRSRRGSSVAASAGGLSEAFEMKTARRIVGNDGDSLRGRHVATSAPVNVPDWSNIYRVDSDDDNESTRMMMVPPHEYLARSHGSAAKSVFEGVGRTLKGRDMSRVRDAVWSQTGFDG